MAMQAAYIDDLSHTLEAVLQDASFATMFPELAAADIVFDRPLDPFTPPKTTIDLFLYDIRENLDLRLNEVTTTKVGNQVITHPAALRLACSYLVTAWPVGGTDLPLQEQRLLSEVLVVLSHYPIIPAAFLVGSMVGQDPSLPMVALHPDALKNLAEFWSSLGSKLKASLTVTVTISVPIFSDIAGFPVTAETIGVTQGAATETLIEAGGQVVNLASQPVAGALVDILNLSSVPVAQQQTSDSNGQYVFTQVNAGNYQLRAVAVGFKPQVQPVTIPASPNDFVIQLTPL
jgi:Pvc16 N-terminal domain/Carboxypeptidase regulatory-like domain